MADKTTPEFCGLINARICSMILNCKKEEIYIGGSKVRVLQIPLILRGWIKSLINY